MSRRAPVPLAQALDRVLARRAPEGLLAAVQRAWPEAVGPAIAAAAEPVGEREGVIRVECESAVWAGELDLMQRHLAAKLNQTLGGEPVAGLRFSARPG